MNRAITPDAFPWFDYSRYSFSLGLEVGEAVLLSGHSASEYDPLERKIVVRGAMSEQVGTAYEKIGVILDAAGRSFDDVDHVVEYVTKNGIDTYGDVCSVRESIFGDRSVPVSTVVVESLLREDALIEVEIVASPPGGQEANDGLVYLPTVYPIRDGQIAAVGDIVGQTEQIYKNARNTLEKLGLSMGNVVKTTEMIRANAVVDYRPTWEIRAEYLAPLYPGAVGIVQERVAANDDILISVDFVASIFDKTVVNPGWSFYENLTYSPGIRAGNVLFMSGQAALDPETGEAVHVGDIAAQAEYTYRNVIAVLQAAGLSERDLVRTVEFVSPKGLPKYRETAMVRKKLLPKPYPASTGVLCHSLLRPQFEIEVDPLAYFEN